MKERQPKASTDFTWTPEQIKAYHQQYRHLSRGDSKMAGVVIKAFARHRLVGQFDSAHIIGAGGVPRGAGIVIPTLTETASLVISDKTEANVASTQEIMEQIRLGDPRQVHWRPHEQDMARHHPRWAGAIGRAAAIATFTTFDLLGDEVPRTAISGMEYVAESILSDKDDYEKAIRNFTNSAEEAVYMAYSVNSDGYMVGDTHHPAYPVSVDQAAEYIERAGFELLHDPYDGFAPKNDEFRQENDPHAFDGFAALAAVRR
jgi:hypothetical protein